VTAADVDSLVSWLGQQLDEDQRVAEAIREGGLQAPQWQAAGEGTWVAVTTQDRYLGDPPEIFEAVDEPVALVANRRGEAAHIARWDPDRVLAEVAAKRRILRRWETAKDAVAVSAGTVLAGAARLRLQTVEMLILDLAQPMAGRPGWRDEWAAGG